MQRYEDILDEQHQIETRLAVFQHEMLHSFELVFRYLEKRILQNKKEGLQNKKPFFY